MTKRQSNEETFAAKVAECKEEWEAGSYAAMVEAFVWSAGNGLPLPPWLFEAVLIELNRAGGYLEGAEQKKGGRGKGSPSVQEKAMAVHAVRWSLATRFLEMRDHLPVLGKPATRQGAFELASERLQGHPSQGTTKQIETSFNKVQRAIREGHGLRYGIRAVPP